MLRSNKDLEDFRTTTAGTVKFFHLLKVRKLKDKCLHFKKMCVLKSFSGMFKYFSTTKSATNTRKLIGVLGEMSMKD